MNPESDIKSRLVLIDAMNFFYKKFKNQNGGTVCAEDGFHAVNPYVIHFVEKFASLRRRLNAMAVRKDVFVMCFDNGYDRRLEISEKAKEEGLIKKAYKEERRCHNSQESLDEKIAFRNMMSGFQFVREMLDDTIVRQAAFKGEEGDDIIGTLVKKYKDSFDEVVIVSADKDCYQLLSENVFIYKLHSPGKYYTIADFQQEFDLMTGEQWVDVGALVGESGKARDTIPGVPAIGMKKACLLIRKYESLDLLVRRSKRMLERKVARFGGDWEKMLVAVKKRRFRLKRGKMELRIIANERLARLSYELKKMHTELPIAIKTDERFCDIKAITSRLESRGIEMSLDFLEKVRSLIE